jgi:GT2 family glycosyltransferase
MTWFGHRFRVSQPADRDSSPAVSSAVLEGGESLGILVCTRNRPEDLKRCLASIARSKPPGTQLVVVDQSDGGTAQSVRDIVASHYEAIYLPSGKRGLSIARNQGIGLIDRDYILCTDDDCEVEPDWAWSWIKVLEREPTIGIGFGRVTDPPANAEADLTPTYDPIDPRPLDRRQILVHGFADFGIGANMVLSRQAWRAVGGFDELLGAGARFPGAEEADMAVRVVRAGYRHVRDRAPSVVHHGSRWDADASQLARSYALGAGAMLAKLSRCGDFEAVLWTCGEIIRRSQALARNLLRGTKPFGFRHLTYFLKGMVASVPYKVDRTMRVYRQS